MSGNETVIFANAAGGSNKIGSAAFLSAARPIDFVENGERWLRSGYVEVDQSKFDAQLWAGSFGATWYETLNEVVASKPWGSLSEANGRIFASATNDAGQFFSTTDGHSWVSHSGAGGAYGVAYGNGIYVAATGLGTINNKIYTSTDLVTWELRFTLPYRTNKVIFANGIFLVIGNDAMVYSSVDGISWTSRNAGFAAGQHCKDICWTGTQFIIVGGLGNGTTASKVATSPDGLTWTNKIIPHLAATSVDSVAYSNGIIVLVQPSHAQLRSKDNGATWSLFSAESKFNEVRPYQDGFLAIGYSSLFKSVDAIQWEKVEIPAYRGISGVVATTNFACAVGMVNSSQDNRCILTTKLCAGSSIYVRNGSAFQYLRVS